MQCHESNGENFGKYAGGGMLLLPEIEKHCILAEKVRLISKNTLEVYVKEIRHQEVGEDLSGNGEGLDLNLFNRNVVEVGLPRKAENIKN